MNAAALVAGPTLLVLTWLSILRTVFIPHRRSGYLMRVVVRAVQDGGGALARRLSPPYRERLLDLCAPVALLIVGCCWVLATFTGTALLGPAVAGVPADAAGLADFMLLRTASRGELVAIAGWLMVVGTVLVLLLHLSRITTAYGRRERVVARLMVHSSSPSEAECLLAERLRNGARPCVDQFFGEWTEWLADIGTTHTGYPALTCYRSVTELCWLDAVVLVLDAAALTEAVAPAWAPPSARSVLQAGAACMPALARQVGIDLPRQTVSLQGREERGFEHSVRVAVTAGLPEQRGYEAAWETFQNWRTRYAPHAAAMRARLLYGPGADKLEPCPVDRIDMRDLTDSVSLAHPALTAIPSAQDGT